MVKENNSQLEERKGSEVEIEQSDSSMEQHDHDLPEGTNTLQNEDSSENESLVNEGEKETEEVSEEQKVIQQLQQELAEKQERLLRLQADFENYRRRVRLDQEAQAKYRAQSLIADILPVLDNFERALSLQVNSEDEATIQFLKGMEMVYRQLTEALKKEGLEAIEAVGSEFDPNFHQAVMQVEDENYGANIVVSELQKGYILKDRVIRPTMVKVNQ